MQIGIIGAGFIARAVAAVATRHGHEVMVSNTRGPDTLFVGTIGCRAGTPQEAAVFGDIALLAIPLKAYGATPRRAPVLSTPVTPCVRKETQ